MPLTQLRRHRGQARSGASEHVIESTEASQIANGTRGVQRFECPSFPQKPRQRELTRLELAFVIRRS